MAIRTRICRHCRSQFEYPISRGNDRVYCSHECKCAAKMAKRKSQIGSLICSIDGCGKPPRAAGSALCEMHYSRQRRNGSFDPRQPKGRIEHSAGYTRVYAPQHAVATSGNSYVYEHRKVYHDAHGDGPFMCHVCGAHQEWSTMHVDHLDDDPKNNDLGNLAPACPTCNKWRGRHKAAAASRARGVRITSSGRTMCVSEWAREVGLPAKVLHWRIKAGWDVDLALSSPIGPTGPKTNVARAVRQRR